MTRPNTDPLEALMRRVEIDVETGCWNRSGALVRGYPVVKIQGKQHRAARLSYELHVGPIPGALTIDHLCRNTRCVNPEHMEPVTAAENARRMAQATRPTHCPSGHPYDETNLVVYNGRMNCRACRKLRNDQNREYRRDRKRAIRAGTWVGRQPG